jgi:hypothetical protein
VLKKVLLNLCPNPECGAYFENLILVCDESKNPVEKFYGCPCCFFKLDPTVINTLKKVEKLIEVKDLGCATKSKEEENTNCPEYFGYLADKSNFIMPIECLDCEKMTQCINKKK